MEREKQKWAIAKLRRAQLGNWVIIMCETWNPGNYYVWTEYIYNHVWTEYIRRTSALPLGFSKRSAVIEVIKV